jgi:hypothetical protein
MLAAFLNLPRVLSHEKNICFAELFGGDPVGAAGL